MIIEIKKYVNQAKGNYSKRKTAISLSFMQHHGILKA